VRFTDGDCADAKRITLMLNINLTQNPMVAAFILMGGLQRKVWKLPDMRTGSSMRALVAAINANWIGERG